MADGLIQKTEDGRQKTEVLSRRSRAFNKCAAQRHTNLSPQSSVLCLLSSVLCLLIPAFCCAEELPDPTRPPASLAAPGAAPGHGATGSRPSGLQSTIISGSRRAAIIDGKTVELGAKHGDARLVEVNEGSVVLRGEQTRRVLTLFPDVKMTRRKIKNVSPESVVQPETQKANQMMHEEK